MVGPVPAIGVFAGPNPCNGISVWTTQFDFFTSRPQVIAEMQQPLPKAQSINVAQAFAQALGLHRQGRLNEAEHLYAEILAARPDHVDTLQMMGLIKLAKGQPGEALQLVSAAVRGCKLQHRLVAASRQNRVGFAWC
jgi:predicted Zn-dependent protease